MSTLLLCPQGSPDPPLCVVGLCCIHWVALLLLQGLRDEEGEQLVELPRNYLAIVEGLIRKQRSESALLQGWLGPTRFQGEGEEEEGLLQGWLGPMRFQGEGEDERALTEGKWSHFALKPQGICCWGAQCLSNAHPLLLSSPCAPSFSDLPISQLPDSHSDPAVQEGLGRIKVLDAKLQV